MEISVESHQMIKPWRKDESKVHIPTEYISNATPTLKVQKHFREDMERFWGSEDQEIYWEIVS